MSSKNEDYWYHLWHDDKELHRKLMIKNVQQIEEGTVVSVYGDTDSIFVGFDPAIKSCTWKNNLFNEKFLNTVKKPYRIISKEELPIDIGSDKFMGYLRYDKQHDSLFLGDEKIKQVPDDTQVLIIEGSFVKDYSLNAILEKFEGNVVYNWSRELDFIHGLDRFRIAGYFKQMLEEHAASYGVENVEDFELEKISESMINIEKKKYIQHITWEDGIEHEQFSYIQPKGVELVRSSTALFARDKEMGIYRIVNYLFKRPDDFNIKELINIIKDMRKEFEMADINDISNQSSCSNYKEKVISDKDRLEFVGGAHFAVKAAAYHNYLLHKNHDLQNKYEFMRSGDKIKYYYTLNSEEPIFAFKRGEFPMEFAPPVDYDVQFDKVILSPVNAIIKKLGMPEINKRLNVLMDILGGI